MHAITETLVSLTSTLAMLEQQRADVLQEISAWSPDHSIYRPAPTAWSAVEVLDHLVRVEREILAATQRGIATPHPRRIRDRVRVAMLDWLFRSDRRVRAPTSVPAILPSSQADLATLRHEWAEVRHDLAQFLALLPHDYPDSGVFKHPVAGWMSIPQVLRFFWVHTHHHRFQLARLRIAESPS